MKAFGAEPHAYVFPPLLRAAVPLGDVTLNHFFRRLDFGVADVSLHGTRGRAATLLRDHGFSREVFQLVMAHAQRNKATAAYHHHAMAVERSRALKYLVDQIDSRVQAAHQESTPAVTRESVPAGV